MTRITTKIMLLTVMSFVVLSAAAKDKKEAKAKPVTVNLQDGQGKSVGTAVLSSKGAPSGVSMKLSFHGLPPGQHALHFHQKAQCDAPDFKSAGREMRARKDPNYDAACFFVQQCVEKHLKARLQEAEDLEYIERMKRFE